MESNIRRRLNKSGGAIEYNREICPLGGPYGLRHLRVRNHMVSRLDSESGPPGRQSAITDILDFERSSWTRRSPGQEDDNCGGVSPDRICFLAPGAATICATGRAIAELMVARYRDAQSLDHQAEAIAATGLRLTRTELAKWAIRAADMLAPTAEAIRAVGLASCDLSLHVGRLHVGCRD